MFDVTSYGATGDGTTDDTAAIQAAIDAAAAAGGGEILFPSGVYLVGGALQDTGNANCQLKLPLVSLADPTVTITFKGALAPPKQFFTWGDPPEPPYSIIKSTLTGASGSAACISGPVSSAIDANQNNVQLNVENLVFEAPPNPSFTMLHLQHHQACHIHNVLIHAGTVKIDQVTQPTNSNAFGVTLPEWNHSPYVRIEGLTVFGCYYGLRNGEKIDATGVRCWACAVGLAIPFAFHNSWFGTLDTYWTPVGIQALGGGPGGRNYCYFEIASYGVEHANGHGQAWQNIAVDIDDTNNWLRGKVTYHTVESGIGPDGVFLVNGAADVECVQLGTSATPPPPPPPPPPPATGDIVDDFTDTNGTPIQSHAITPTNEPSTSWTADEGGIEIQDNKAQATTDLGVRSASVDAGTPDCTIQVTVSRSVIADTAIKFRSLDANNYWIADLRASDNNFRIYEKLNGQYIERASIAKTFATSTPYVLQVVLDGDSITATVDGGSTLAITNSSGATRTRHGIWVSLASGVGAAFENFAVSN